MEMNEGVMPHEKGGSARRTPLGEGATFSGQKVIALMSATPFGTKGEGARQKIMGLTQIGGGSWLSPFFEEKTPTEDIKVRSGLAIQTKLSAEAFPIREEE